MPSKPAKDHSKASSENKLPSISEIHKLRTQLFKFADSLGELAKHVELKEKNLRSNSRTVSLNEFHIPYGQDQPIGGPRIIYLCRTLEQSACTNLHKTRSEAEACQKSYQKSYQQSYQALSSVPIAYSGFPCREKGQARCTYRHRTLQKAKNCQRAYNLCMKHKKIRNADTNVTKGAIQRNNFKVKEEPRQTDNLISKEKEDLNAMLMKEVQNRDRRSDFVTSRLPKLRSQGDVVLRIDNLPYSRYASDLNSVLGTTSLKSPQVTTAVYLGKQMMHIRIVIQSGNEDINRILNINKTEILPGRTVIAQRTDFKDLESFLGDNIDRIGWLFDQ